MAQRFFAEAWPPQSRWDKNNIFWGKATGSEPVLAEKEETKGGTSRAENKKSANVLIRWRIFSAQERTRTFVASLPLAPETSASTDFATWAFYRSFPKKDLSQNNKIRTSVQWCPEQDSNLHAVNRHYPLKVACLPISPSGLDYVSMLQRGKLLFWIQRKPADRNRVRLYRVFLLLT